MAEQNNPYGAPSALVADITQAVDDGRLIESGQAVPTGNGWQWIVDGFNLFKLSPGIWIVNLIILFVILFVLGFIGVVGQLATYVLFPIFSGGLMLGCHALARNQPLEVAHLFAGFRQKAGPLAVVGLLYLVGLIVILGIAGVFVGFGVLAAMFSGVLPAAGMVLLMLLIVMGLSIPLAMAIWFAPALVVFHDVQPFDAMKQSFTGSLKNIVPFLVYGIIGFVISIIATIPAGLGWLAWGPTLVASIYTAYRDIFVQAA